MSYIIIVVIKYPTAKEKDFRKFGPLALFYMDLIDKTSHLLPAYFICAIVIYVYYSYVIMSI